MHHEQRPPSQSRPLNCSVHCGGGSRSARASSSHIGWSNGGKTRSRRASTNLASQNGDKLSTLMQLNVFAMQIGMILVGVGDLPGNHWSGGAHTDLNRLGTSAGPWDKAMPTKQCRASGTSTPPNASVGALRLSLVVSKMELRSRRSGLTRLTSEAKSVTQERFLLANDTVFRKRAAFNCGVRLRSRARSPPPTLQVACNVSSRTVLDPLSTEFIRPADA